MSFTEYQAEQLAKHKAELRALWPPSDEPAVDEVDVLTARVRDLERRFAWMRLALTAAVVAVCLLAVSDLVAMFA